MSRTEKFVNRSAELEFFLNELRSAEPKNRVILIEGVSGVGKSALTKRLLAESRERIAVKIENISAVHQEGFYIREIAKALDGSATQGQASTSLGGFLKALPSRETRRRYDKTLISEILEVKPVSMAKPLITMAQRHFGAGEFSTDQLLRSAESEDILILTDYIRWILNTNDSAVVNVENVQVTDPTSLRLLGEEILSVHHGHLFLFEYTSDKPGLHDISNIEELCLRSGSVVKRLRLKKLDFDDLLELVSEHQVVALLERAYSEHNGNLREIEDLQLLYSQGCSTKGFAFGLELTDWPVNFTASHIRALNKSAVFLLTCIATHQGVASLDLLYAFYEHSEQLRNLFVDIEATLAELTAQKLARIRDNIATISHDSIAHIILHDESFKKYVLVAFKTWSVIYNDIYKKKDFSVISRHDALFHLSRCYVNIDPTLLLGLMDEIKEVAINSLYPRAALTLLEKLRSSFDRSTSERSEIFDRVNFALLDVYYSLGLFDESQAILTQIKGFPARQAAYRATILDRLDRHQEAIDFIKDTFARIVYASKPYELTLKLILMTSYRSLNMFSRCENVWREIVADKSLQNVPEYGYALRNGEMVLPLADSLACVKNSIDFFHQNGRTLDEARSRISHAMLLVDSGELQKASEELEIARSMLEGKTIERHVILNNRAVVMLYRELPDWQHAIDLLTNALRTITTAFDKVAIYNNLTLAAALGGRHEFVESVEEKLLIALDQQPDKVVHRIAFYNLAFAADRRGDADARNQYLMRARNSGLGDNPDDGVFGTYNHYWSTRLSGEALSQDSDYRFLARFPYEAIYVTYWHFDIPPLDLSSN